MSEVTLMGHIIVPVSALDVVEAELPTHIQLTRDEPGCIEFSVTQDKTTPTIFYVSERFESPAAFAHHQNRVRTSKWGAITTDVARHYTITGLDHHGPWA